MHKYKIKKQELNFYGVFTVTIQGEVIVNYPAAKITILASATLCSDKVYQLSLNPDKDKWSDEQTHKWTAANYPVTVRLTIDKASPKLVKAEVLGNKKGEKGSVLWHDTFDIFDPYKKRKIEIFAQPAFIDPIRRNADHTYAVGYDDNGQRHYLWPCGGDHDENQRSIGEGEAFQPECDCLSQMRVDPATHGLAGIRYGFDGVCHQATNRIVCPSCLEVSEAKGYKNQKGWRYLTYTLYGRLGVKHESGLKKWESIKQGCLTKHYAHCSENVKANLFSEADNILSEEQLGEVEVHAERVRKQMLETYHHFSQGKLITSEYVNRMNAYINVFKSELAGVLGEENHRVLFDDIADEDVIVVVPAIAERVFAKDVPAL